MNTNRALPVKMNFIAIILLLIIVPRISAQNETFSLTVSTHDITVLVGEKEYFELQLSGRLEETINLTFVRQHESLIHVIPSSISIKPNDKTNESESIVIGVLGRHPGHVEITSKSIPNDTWISHNVFLRVIVANSLPVLYLSLVFGWIYFLAWSVSFYPQIYENFRRKSVVGLNFDFLSLNIVGFILYSVFNAGLFWSKEIQAEYSRLHPRGLNPVLINDIFFSFHATFATLITIFQCFMYERGDQRVSITARSILGVFITLVVIFAILAGTSVIHWLDFLYYCSYIKLAITLIKYIPQAVMNYRRKSTIGWSIGNIILDFSGGILSMLQMILNAYNYDDWESIFGDPTKFGLGLFSVCFDILFMLQHFVFYRNTQPYTEIPGTTIQEEPSNRPTEPSDDTEAVNT